MSRCSGLVVVLSCSFLFGCAPSDDPGPEEERSEATSGNWTIVASGWSDDDCNAENGLVSPTSITVADVESSSFSVTYYNGDERLGGGSLLCSHADDDVYDCEDYLDGFDYGVLDASVSITGAASITLTSETTATAVGDFVAECEGSDCGTAAMDTNSGEFPCNSTMNWTAEAD